MTTDEGRPGDLTNRGTQDVGPLVEQLSDRLALSDEHDIAIVAHALTRAYVAGARAGMAEIAAQAIEAGLDVQMAVEIVEPDDPLAD